MAVLYDTKNSIDIYLMTSPPAPLLKGEGCLRQSSHLVLLLSGEGCRMRSIK
jgi:hypothetical protein